MDYIYITSLNTQLILKLMSKYILIVKLQLIQEHFNKKIFQNVIIQITPPVKVFIVYHFFLQRFIITHQSLTY